MKDYKDLIFKIISHSSKEYKKAVTLRQDILRKPLGLTFTTQELEKEKDHIHLAGFSDGEIVATAVLVPEGTKCKMQRVAVKQAIQGKGLGSQLMHFSEQVARENGCKEIYCSARSTAISFYLKNGYALEGEPYDEDGIPHQKMSKKL